MTESQLLRRRRSGDFLSQTTTSPTAMIMEDYCASPRHFRSETWSESEVPVTPPAEVFELKAGKKTPEAAATIRDLIDEPNFWRGYTSDEEVASPLVDDNQSFASESFYYDSDDVVSVHAASPSPERPTQSLGKSKENGTQAQAVQFLSAGKAKVVSMSTPRIVRTAPSSPTRPPVSKMNRMNIEGRTINFSRTITPKASSEIGPRSTRQESGDDLPFPKRVVRRKPNLQALQAVSRSQSPSHGSGGAVSPLTAKRGGFVEPDSSDLIQPLSEAAWFSQSNTPEERPSSQTRQPIVTPVDREPEPYPAQEASPVPDTPSLSMSQERSSNYALAGSSSAKRPALLSTGSYLGHDTYTFPDSPSLSRPRILRKLSSTLSFKAFSRPSRHDSFSSNESEKLQPVNESNHISDRSMADMHIPTRTSSKPVTKMIPRGANERAPPIVIPPCPDNYDDGEVLPARWPKRKDSVPGAAQDDTAVAEQEKSPRHARKKSNSTSSGSGSS